MSLLGRDDATAVLLSLKVAATATVCALPLALVVANGLARRRFWGRSLVEALITLPLVLPPVATGFGLLLLLGRRGLIGRALSAVGVVFAFHWTGAAIAAGVMAFPLMVRPIRQAIEAIDPEADEAAITLGAGPFTRFARITVPLAMPGVAAGAILGFARALGEFGATITFVAAIPGETLTLPTDIYQATQSPGDEGRALALCGVSALLAIGAVLVSEFLTRRVSRSIVPAFRGAGTAG